jgi:hypothetical protein
MLEMIAASCVQTNLRRFHARDYLMRAVFCELGKPMVMVDAEPDPLAAKVMIFNDKPIMDAINTASRNKYDSVIELMHRYETIDFIWKNCKEKFFIMNLIDLRLKWDEHGFADHLYYYNLVRPLELRTLKCLKAISEELLDEVERRDQRLQREICFKERLRRRNEKKEFQKKLNYEMGVAGPVVIEDDDEDRRLLGIVTGETFYGENPKYAKLYMQTFGFKARGEFRDDDDENEGEEKNDDESTVAVEAHDDNELESLIGDDEPEEEEAEEEEQKNRKKRKGKKIKLSD